MWHAQLFVYKESYFFSEAFGLSSAKLKLKRAYHGSLFKVKRALTTLLHSTCAHQCSQQFLFPRLPLATSLYLKGNCIQFCGLPLVSSDC